VVLGNFKRDVHVTERVQIIANGRILALFVHLAVSGVPNAH